MKCCPGSGLVELHLSQTSSLGAWDPRNDKCIRRLLVYSKKYSILMRYLIVSESIRAYRKIFYCHVSVQRQIDVRGRFLPLTLLPLWMVMRLPFWLLHIRLKCSLMIVLNYELLINLLFLWILLLTVVTLSCSDLCLLLISLTLVLMRKTSWFRIPNRVMLLQHLNMMTTTSLSLACLLVATLIDLTKPRCSLIQDIPEQRSLFPSCTVLVTPNGGLRFQSSDSSAPITEEVAIYVSVTLPTLSRHVSRSASSGLVIRHWW